MTAPFWEGAERCLSATESEGILLMEQENILFLNIFILITKQTTWSQEKNGDVRNRVGAEYTVLLTGFGAVWDRHYCIDIQLMHVTELLLFTHKCHKLGWMWPCCSVTHCAVVTTPPGKAVHLWREVFYSIMCKSLTWIWDFEPRVTKAPVHKHKTVRLATNRKTPNLQTSNHRLFTPECLSHKHLIKSAFFQSWYIFYIIAHFQLVAKPLLMFPF